MSRLAPDGCAAAMCLASTADRARIVALPVLACQACAGAVAGSCERGSGSASFAGRSAGYRGDRGVSLVQRPSRPGRRIAVLGGQRKPMDECPAQRQRDGQQQPQPQAPGEKYPHAQLPSSSGQPTWRYPPGSRLTTDGTVSDPAGPGGQQGPALVAGCTAAARSANRSSQRPAGRRSCSARQQAAGPPSASLPRPAARPGRGAAVDRGTSEPGTAQHRRRLGPRRAGRRAPAPATPVRSHPAAWLPGQHRRARGESRHMASSRDALLPASPPASISAPAVFRSPGPATSRSQSTTANLRPSRSWSR